MDISGVLSVSITKVLKVLKSTKYRINLEQHRDDYPEIDEFLTQVEKKKNKIWFIYVYHR
ncbi:hypothetical protein Holit_03043 [Hollandina sp. SP2]